jgi:hypothetical protein
MSEKEKQRYVAYLREKVRRISDRLDPPNVAGHLLLNQPVLERFDRMPASALTRSRIERFDRELELAPRMCLGQAALNAIAAELKKQFGFGRIADDPDVVLKRVARRKRIANDEELRIVLDALAVVDDSIDPELRAGVDDAARRYEGLDKWPPVTRVDT